MPFQLPGGDISPLNSGKLKHPDVIENNEGYAVQKAKLLFNGVPFRRGTLKASGYQDDKITTNFLFGLSQVSSDFKTARLRDVMDENIVISALILPNYYPPFTTFLNAVRDGTLHENKFKFPIFFNDNPYGDKAIKENALVNGMKSSSVYVNDPNYGIAAGIPFAVKNHNSLQPFVHLKFVLNKIAARFGFSIEGDFFSDPEVVNMLLYNTSSLDIRTRSRYDRG